MKNILLIIPYAGVGGIERLAFTFYKHFTNAGYNVKVVKIIKLETDLFNFGSDEFFLSQIDLSKMSSFKRMLFYLVAPFRLRKLILRENISDSISFGDMANVFSSLTFTDEFKIGSIHSLKSIELSNKNLLNKIFKISYNTSYKNLNKIVCISNAIKTDLINNCNFKDKEKLKVIYNPHDINEIVSKSKEIIPENEQHLFDNKTIVFLGRFSIQKAIWHLIKAFSVIETNNVNLIFIGDGDDAITKTLKDLVKKLYLNENVYFLGRKSNPYKYLVKADVLALSSYWEGTPNVIVEAIILNVPIVSSFCTDGIVEMMSVKTKEYLDGLIYTESGFITPTLFKGVMEIPKDDTIIEEEIKFSNALDFVLNSNKYKEIMIVNKIKLLEKYKLEVVSNLYLKNN